jgi:hypothetical protein
MVQGCGKMIIKVLFKFGDKIKQGLLIFFIYNQRREEKTLHGLARYLIP